MSKAVFVIRTAMHYFVNHYITVTVSEIDISKSASTIGLFLKLCHNITSIGFTGKDAEKLGYAALFDSQ